MKRLFYIFAAFIGIAAAACSSKGQQQNSESSDEAPQQETAAEASHVLVAYFSATGNTKAVAEEIANATNGFLYEIAPESPYTEQDLDWRNNQSRSSVEMSDESSRPAIAGDALDMTAYDIVFIGYPIWWNLPPRIINTFIEANDLSGKTIIPFATSGSSTIDNSVANLKQLYPQYTWADGLLLNDVSAAADAAAEMIK